MRNGRTGKNVCSFVFHNLAAFEHVPCFHKTHSMTSHGWKKENQLNICTDILQQAEADDNFMKLMVVGDETWVYVFSQRPTWCKNFL